MEKSKYQQIKKYVALGILPEEFPSTKGNFIKMARQFHVNGNGRLMFQNLIVLLKSERQSLFEELHGSIFKVLCRTFEKYYYFYEGIQEEKHVGNELKSGN